MGLLDTVMGALQGAGNQTAASPGLSAGLGELLGGSSGLTDLVQKFEQGGLGSTISSWISTGHNLPISAEQLQQVLGNDAVAQLAQKMGLDPAQATAQLSKILPQVVDKLTPSGQVPSGAEHGNFLGEVLGQLTRS